MAQNPGGQAYPWQGALLLDEGETVNIFWKGNHAVMEMSTLDGRAQEVEMRKPGYLVMTSRKIVFMEERGVFNKSYHLDCGMPLETVEGISMGGMVMKYVSIGGAAGENKFHLEGIDAKTFSNFLNSVQSQIQLRKKEIENQRTQEDVQAMVDFSILRDYMAKGGISLQAVKCPQCKAPLTMPETGSFVKCTYCGATIYASNIMDRVKQLIG